MAASKGPRLRLYIDEKGATADELRGIIERAREPKPVMRVIQQLMMEGAAEQFESEGSRGGYHWAADKEKYVARKLKEGHDERIEIRKGDLRMSLLARSGGGNAIRRLSKASTTVGTRLFYSVFQGHRRQLLTLTSRDQDIYAEKMIDYLLTGTL